MTSLEAIGQSRVEKVGPDPSGASTFIFDRLFFQFCALRRPFWNTTLERRREAVPVLVEGLRLEVCPLGRTDAPLPQTHRRPAVPVPFVRARLLAFRPPGAAHEAPHQHLIDDIISLSVCLCVCVSVCECVCVRRRSFTSCLLLLSSSSSCQYNGVPWNIP